LGYFDLVIKVYFANAHPRFPNGGLVSQHLNGIKIGDRIEVKGPFGHIEYQGRGAFQIAKQRIKAAHVGLICGGTGITPAYQMIQTALRDDGDETCFYLLLANQVSSSHAYTSTDAYQCVPMRTDAYRRCVSMPPSPPPVPCRHRHGLTISPKMSNKCLNV